MGIVDVEVVGEGRLTVAVGVPPPSSPLVVGVAPILMEGEAVVEGRTGVRVGVDKYGERVGG